MIDPIQVRANGRRNTVFTLKMQFNIVVIQNKKNAILFQSLKFNNF